MDLLSAQALVQRTEEQVCVEYFAWIPVDLRWRNGMIPDHNRRIWLLFMKHVFY